MPSPKTFISYSWTSPEHQQWATDDPQRDRLAAVSGN
jgi:hypothetical protein